MTRDKLFLYYLTQWIHTYVLTTTLTLLFRYLCAVFVLILSPFDSLASEERSGLLECNILAILTKVSYTFWFILALTFINVCILHRKKQYYYFLEFTKNMTRLISCCYLTYYPQQIFLLRFYYCLLLQPANNLLNSNFLDLYLKTFIIWYIVAK